MKALLFTLKFLAAVPRQWFRACFFLEAADGGELIGSVIGMTVFIFVVACILGKVFGL